MVHAIGLRSGSEFPHEADRQRISAIQTNRQLWARDHAAVFAAATAGMSQSQKEALLRQWAGLRFVNCNLLRRLSRDTAELLALDPAAISSEDQDATDAIAEIRELSGWDALALDAAEAISALGSLGLRVYETATGDHAIGLVEPDSILLAEDYFTDYHDARPDAARIYAPMVASLHGDEGRYYVLLEIHAPGAVEWRAFHWSPEIGSKAATLADKGYLGSEVDPSEVDPAITQVRIDTAIAEPTLVVVLNEPDPYSRRHGLSDYTPDLVDLQRELEHKLSVLMRHFHELVNGGTTVLPEETKAMILRGDRRSAPDAASDFGRKNAAASPPQIDAGEINLIFENGQNKGMTRHVSRSAQYDGGLKALQILLSFVEEIGSISLSRLLDHSAAPESGRALRLARLKDIKRAKRKAIRFAGAFSRAFEVALLLRGIDATVDYAFPEPFPLGLHERIEAASAAVQKPILSRATALVDIMGFTPEQAENEDRLLNADAHTDGLRSTIRGAFGLPPASPAEFADDGGDE